MLPSLQNNIQQLGLLSDTDQSTLEKLKQELVSLNTFVAKCNCVTQCHDAICRMRYIAKYYQELSDSIKKDKQLLEQQRATAQRILKDLHIL